MSNEEEIAMMVDRLRSALAAERRDALDGVERVVDALMEVEALSADERSLGAYRSYLRVKAGIDKLRSMGSSARGIKK